MWTFKYLLLTGSGYLQLYLSYLSLDLKLLSGSSYLFLGRIVVVLASEFESYDAPLFRLRLTENEKTCQGHAARIFQGTCVEAGSMPSHNHCARTGVSSHP